MQLPNEPLVHGKDHH